MIDSWNPAVLNETTQAIDSWNPAELNQVTKKVDSWNTAILNNNLESTTPVVFSATITASFPEGATCTATDGTTTLTADDNPMVFSIPNEGTWAVACVANGVTFSEEVVIDTDGQTESVYLTPVGETVTPTDSVPMLIACAGIGDSEITTIAGALADVETLTAILESENAIDYLVRSTTFASDVTADSVAMTGIGSINYDANTLLADSTWSAAICNSTYFESVLNVKVPKMTSNTKPSGVVSASSSYSDRLPWRAFDGVDNVWQANSISNQYIQYQFTNDTRLACVTITSGSNANRTPKDYKIQYSTDGQNFIDLTDTINGFDGVTAGTVTHPITTVNNAKYFRISISTSWGTVLEIKEMQFYCRNDV